MKRLLFLLILAACGDNLSVPSAPDAVVAIPPDAPTDTAAADRCTLALIAGQSNAQGIGPSQGLPPELRGGLPNVYEAHLGTLNDPPRWIAYGPGPVQPLAYNGGTYFGIEMSLAQDAGLSLEIFKMAISGSTLATQWAADGAWPRGGANLAHQAFELAAEHAASSGCRPVVIWIQGESDAATESNADAYAARLAALAALSRVYLPGVRWIVGRVNSGTDNSIAPYTSTIQAQEAAFVAADSNAVLVDQDSALLSYDHLHYTAAGYLTLGHLYAAAIR